MPWSIALEPKFPIHRCELYKESSSTTAVAYHHLAPDRVDELMSSSCVICLSSDAPQQGRMIGGPMRLACVLAMLEEGWLSLLRQS